MRVPWRARVSARLRAMLPCACVQCGRIQGDVVCDECVADLDLAGAPRCPVCALGLAHGRLHAETAETADAAGPCATCRLLPPPFDAAVALADYRPPQDALVLALKFRGTLALAPWLGRHLAHALAQRGLLDGSTGPPIVTPIPLGPHRLAQRGFNQSWEIARALAARLACPADAALLARRHDTATQSALPLADRHANIAGAFSVPCAARVAGRHIVLVDDVMTTGATLGEAAALLKRYGAARVTVAVVLRTPAPGGQEWFAGTALTPGPFSRLAEEESSGLTFRPQPFPSPPCSTSSW